MQDDPTPVELIRSVADFLRDEIAPQLSGHAAFKLRVSINALDLVGRELMLGDRAHTQEKAGLSALLKQDGSLLELNRTLAGKIARDEIDLQTPGLSDHLWRTTMDKLAVDQPNYAAYKRELDRE